MRTRPFPKGSAHPPELLTSRARQMLASPTPAEQRLFEAIRGGRLGVQFKRQVPIAGRFIADLLAPKARLIIEVDGEYYQRRARADARRDEALQRLGYRVLRLDAELVEHQLPVPVALIQEELARLLR